MAKVSDPVALDTKLKDWILNNISTDFRTAIKLTYDESKNDPSTDPFRSLYTARDLLVALKDKLNSSSDDLKCNEDFKILLSCLDLELGLNYINAEETGAGEKLVEGCIKTLDGLPGKVKTASVCIQAYNQLGIMWGNRNEQQKALEVLLKAKAVYESHIALSPPMTSTEWLESTAVPVDKREKQFENLHTLTLFYLAQVYGNLSQPKISAQYCQNTLSRQLETQEYDAIEWSLNCVTLSQYYLGEDNFKQSRHCLASANCVFDKYLSENSEGKVLDPEFKEKLESVKADISRCWTKYCVTLLKTSQEKLENEVQATERPRVKMFLFDTLEVADYEGSLSCELIESYDGAKPVFLHGQKHISISAKYYSLETFASENVKIVQDHSLLYKLLAYFEPSNEIKCRMHKRRYDLLSTLLGELNPQYFLSTCQQLMYELGDIESMRADLKTVHSSDSPSTSAVAKINKLVQSSIQFYEQFIATFEDHSTHQLPEPMEVENLRPVLCAKLYLARLHSKIISPNSQAQRAELQKAIDTFTWIVHYCDSHVETAGPAFSDFLPICRDMAELLPKKLAAIDD